MAQRCEHLQDGQRGEIYVTLGIAAELCDDCLLEIKRRLETETRPETPIEAYAREREAAMESCTWVKKDKTGTVIESCRLAAQTDSAFCPRHTYLYNLKEKEDYEKDQQKRLENEEIAGSKRAPRTRVQHCKDGYIFQGSSVCKCGKRIEWWRTPKLKTAPYNPMPNETSIAVSHYATCPLSRSFRKAS